MAKVFISYSHQDEGWKDRLVKQLNVLSGPGLEVWDDQRIAAGDAWKAEIENAIATCDVALLLISADFLTSQFILSKEVPPLLQRREREGIRVIPVILSPCQWTRIDWLNPIQARPGDNKSLLGMSEHEAEAALSELAGEIADLMVEKPTRGAGESSGSEPHEPPTQATSRTQGRLVEYFLLRLLERMKCSVPATEAALLEHVRQLGDEAAAKEARVRGAAVSAVTNHICAALREVKAEAERHYSANDEINAVNRVAQALELALLGTMVRWKQSGPWQSDALLELHNKPQVAVFAAVLQTLVPGEVGVQVLDRRSGRKADDLVCYTSLFEIAPEPNGLATHDVNALQWGLHCNVFKDTDLKATANQEYDDDLRAVLIKHLSSELSGQQSPDGQPLAVGLYYRDRGDYQTGKNSLLDLMDCFKEFGGLPPVAYLHDAKEAEPQFEYLLSPAILAAELGSVWSNSLQAPSDTASSPPPSQNAGNASPGAVHVNVVVNQGDDNSTALGQGAQAKSV